MLTDIETFNSYKRITNLHNLRYLHYVLLYVKGLNIIISNCHHTSRCESRRQSCKMRISRAINMNGRQTKRVLLWHGVDELQLIVLASTESFVVCPTAYFALGVSSRQLKLMRKVSHKACLIHTD